MRSKAAASGSCLDEVTLAAYADGQLNDNLRSQVESHLADCGYCLDAVADVVEMQREHVSGAGSPSPRWTPRYTQPDRRRLSRHLMPVAAALLISLIGYQAWTSFNAPHPPAFDSQAPRLLRSMAGEASLNVLTPQPDADVPSVFDFQFEPHAEARSYSILVVSDEGEPVWQARGVEPSGRIPREAGLEPGQKYFLRVEASGARGERWHSSFVPFTVTP